MKNKFTFAIKDSESFDSVNHLIPGSGKEKRRKEFPVCKICTANVNKEIEISSYFTTVKLALPGYRRSDISINYMFATETFDIALLSNGINKNIEYIVEDSIPNGKMTIQVYADREDFDVEKAQVSYEDGILMLIIPRKGDSPCLKSLIK